MKPHPVPTMSLQDQGEVFSEYNILNRLKHLHRQPALLIAHSEYQHNGYCHRKNKPHCRCR